MRPIISILTILLYCHTSFATKTITQIDTSDIGINNIISTSAVINGNFIFADRYDNLWITNGTLSSFKPFEINQSQVIIRGGEALVKLNDFIYFINATDSSTLWKTDGNNSQRVSDISLSHILRIIDDKIHTLSPDRNLLILEDGQFSEINLSVLEAPRIHKICKINSNSYIMIDISNLDGVDKMYQVTDTQITQIESDLFTGQGLIEKLSFKYSNNGFCYYEYKKEESDHSKKYLQISESGIVEKVVGHDGENTIEYWQDVIELNRNLYFIKRTNLSDLKAIYRIQDNSSQPVRMDSFDLNAYIVGTAVSDNYIYLLLNQLSVSPFSPDFQIVNVYDESLNLISTLDNSLNTIPVIYTIAGQDVAIGTQGIYSKIQFTNNGLNTLTMPSPIAKVANVVGDEFGVFMINELNRNEVFKVSNQAIISRQLTGLWVSPEWDRQGISINTGKRLDGSEYLFISLYIYKDGYPFWIAGTQDIDQGSDSISIDLFEFTGPSFISGDGDQDVEQFSFGTISLTPMGCNQINVNLSTNTSDQVEMLMTRISDTTNNKVCTDLN